MLVSVLLAAALAAGGPPPAELTYTLRRVVEGTGGAYVGWSEQLESRGTYRIVPQGAEVAVEADYAWRYGDSEGAHDAGREQRAVTFAADTRRYAGRTDLDEYDDVAGSLATWLWIPPDVQVRDTVQVLDHTFVVRALAHRASPTAAPGILAEASGTAARDDVYGRFRYTWTERLWFDPATGLVLAGRYEEHDRGTHEGRAAEFRWTEWLDVTSASYLEGRASPPHPPGFRAWDALASSGSGGLLDVLGPVLFVGVMAAPLAVVGAAAVAANRRRTTTGPVGSEIARSPSLGDFRLRPLAVDADLVGLAAGQRASTRLAPWLVDLVTRTRLGGGAVVAATTTASPPVCVGVGLRDAAGGVGTVLSPCPVVTEAVRRELGLRSFFAEVEHTVDGRPAYNVHERFQVLVRDVPGRRTWDRRLVRPLEPADVEPVVGLLTRAFGEPARSYVEASLAAGDVALVATHGDAIVGVGFAAVTGVHGRLHGLAVDPERRNEGLGSELVSARLAALGDLGVQSVTVEISADHAASLHLARKHGFRPAGALPVLTVDEEPVGRTWRRP